MQTVQQKLKAAGNIEANILQIGFTLVVTFSPSVVSFLGHCLGLLFHTSCGEELSPLLCIRLYYSSKPSCSLSIYMESKRPWFSFRLTDLHRNFASSRLSRFSQICFLIVTMFQDYPIAPTLILYLWDLTQFSLCSFLKVTALPRTVTKCHKPEALVLRYPELSYTSKNSFTCLKIPSGSEFQCWIADDPLGLRERFTGL